MPINHTRVRRVFRTIALAGEEHSNEIIVEYLTLHDCSLQFGIPTVVREKPDGITGLAATLDNLLVYAMAGYRLGAAQLAHDRG